MTDRDLLARVIAASGLSARRFATTVLFRNERTIRRWLASPEPDCLPAEVRAFLKAQAENLPLAPAIGIDYDRGVAIPLVTDRPLAED